MVQQNPRKDAPNGRSKRHNNLIHRLGGICWVISRRTEAVRFILRNPQDELIGFAGLDSLNVEVVDVMVDLGRHLGGEEEEAVGREDQDSILRLVAAFFQLHRCLQQNLNRVKQNWLRAPNRIQNINLLTEY